MSNHQLSIAIRILTGQLNELNKPNELHKLSKLNEPDKLTAAQI